MRGAARAWDVLMLNARRQAEDYARALPADHGWPPFILVCDVGHVIEVYADFSGQGRNCVLHLAGLLRWRRHAHAMAALSVRALPDRGASNSHWLLLSPGGDLRRTGGAGPVVLRNELAAGICHIDDDRHHGRRRFSVRLDAVQPRNQGYGNSFEYSVGVMRCQARTHDSPDLDKRPCPGV